MNPSGKPCAFTDQSLLDHSLGSLKMAKEAFRDSYFRVVERRLRSLSRQAKEEDRLHDVSWSEWRDLTWFLVALHDMGKAAEYYQGKFDDQCKTQRPSFFLHEIGGAVFLYKAKWTNEVVKFWSVLSILNHLNAIRGVDNLSRVRSSLELDMLKLRKYGEPLLQELLKEVSNPFVEKILVQDYQPSDFQDMEGWLSRMNKRFVSGYIYFLFPVIVGDNLDSSASREKEQAHKSRFIRSLQDMVRGENRES